MKIGFDAKRAFFNRSGLGNYSRSTIALLSDNYVDNKYVLYSPKPSKSVPFYKSENISIEGPKNFIHKLLPSYWRVNGIKNQLIKDKLDLFHGLSNELPNRIEKTGIPSIVTVHDLIFLRYPEFYKPIDRRIYQAKFSYAAKAANKVIAVSKQTKDDLVNFMGIDERKIDVVYQGCNVIFWEQAGEGKKHEILSKYLVPKQFILYVGTIEERKNLLNIVKAMHQGKINFPLVVIGRPTPYLAKVKEYIDKERIDFVYFLHNVLTEELPAFYQMAEIFIYPSVFEGFGIPILEALTSKTPVITSKGGCFAEAGGKSSVYVNPDDIEELTFAIQKLLDDPALRDSMVIDGFVHAQQFKQERIAKNIMEVYLKTISEK